MKKDLLDFRRFALVSLLGIFTLMSCSSNDDNDTPVPEINYSGLVLNEICGLQNPDDDWVEILNSTDKAIDISGVQIIRTDESNNKKSIYTVPEKTSIAAGAYKVIATLSNELTEGISNTAQVVITLVKPDGNTSIDKFDRNTNIGTGIGHLSGGSYARLPNGSGSWNVLKTSSRGTANIADEEPAEIDYTGLVLNEICGLQEPDDDWIEIFNSTDKAIDISGVQFIKTDEDNVKETIYTIPDNTTIGAGAYRVISKLSEAFTAGISNSKQVGITLMKPDGETAIDEFDRNGDVGQDTGHILGGSYARLPNGSGDWDVAYTATRGTANEKGELPQVDYTGLILNEICGSQSPDDDWVEIFNSTNKSIDISKVQIIKTDENNSTKSIFTFPDKKSISAGEYIVIATLSGELTAGISNSKQVGITLAKPSGDAIDSFDRDKDVGTNNSHIQNGSYARIPNATGPWAIVKTCTRGIINKADADEPTPTIDYTGLVLNEINGNGTKFIELYNTTNAAIDISGVILKKNSSSLHTIPASTSIPAKTIMTFVSGTDFSGGISAKRSLLIQIFTPDGKTVIDFFKNLTEDDAEEWDVAPPKYNGETATQSYGRFPDGTGSWQMMTASQNTANTVGTTAITW